MQAINNSGTERSKAISNFIWRVLEHVGAKGVSLIVSIILARLLLPSDYGEVAMITVIVQVLSVFVDGGFSRALIQKKDADHLDFSSVFYFNFVMAIVLYIVMFLTAPEIAFFYKMPHLKQVIRVQSLLLIVSGVKSVQNSYVAKKMIFKKFFFATLGGTIGAAVIGIWMAYRGYGVWAIVVQSLFNQTVDTIILWVTVKWRPKKEFSIKRIKELFSFGSRMLVADLVDMSYWGGRQLVVGKFYTSAELAYFNKGGIVPNEVSAIISKGIDDILFPMMSSVQNDKDILRAWVKRSIKLHSYLFYPAMFGMAAISESVVLILYTEKWLPMVPYFCVISLMYLFSSPAVPTVSVTKALGRSDIWLRINYIRAPIHLIGLVIAIRYGVMAVAVAAVITTNISALLCAYPAGKLINYPLYSQIKDMLPHMLLSLFMAGCVFAIRYLGVNVYLTLLIQVTVGIGIYVGLSMLFKLEMFTYTLDLIRNYLPSKKKVI